jgi:hypothetical protein
MKFLMEQQLDVIVSYVKVHDNADEFRVNRNYR